MTRRILLTLSILPLFACIAERGRPASHEVGVSSGANTDALERVRSTGARARANPRDVDAVYAYAEALWDGLGEAHLARDVRSEDWKGRSREAVTMLDAIAANAGDRRADVLAYKAIFMAALEDAGWTDASRAAFEVKATFLSGSIRLRALSDGKHENESARPVCEATYRAAKQENRSQTDIIRLVDACQHAVPKGAAKSREEHMPYVAAADWAVIDKINTSYRADYDARRAESKRHEGCREAEQRFGDRPFSVPIVNRCQSSVWYYIGDQAPPGRVKGVGEIWAGSRSTHTFSSGDTVWLLDGAMQVRGSAHVCADTRALVIPQSCDHLEEKVAE